MGPCQVCGGVQYAPDGRCVNCGAIRGLPPQPPDQSGYTLIQPVVPPPHKDHTTAIVVGAALTALVLAGCVAVVGTGLWRWNKSKTEATGSTATPTAGATRTRTATPSAAPPLVGAACVVGEWQETSFQADAVISGVTVRLTSSGVHQTFAKDGSNVWDSGAGVTQTGIANGDTYVLNAVGTITTHYEVIGNEIHYSNVQATGTSTWLRNGQQIDKEPLTGTLGADTFTCEGNKMILYGTNYTVELSRV
jgi:hypothetical protein